MIDAFEITVGSKSDVKILEGLATDLSTLPGVQGAGTTDSRAIDPVSVMLWVKLAGEAATALASAVAVVKAIMSLLRKRGIKKAQIRLADGSTIAVDNATVDDIKQLLETRMERSTSAESPDSPTSE